ncbi:MAG: OsmC family protein [Chitinophagaceae bacterium]
MKYLLENVIEGTIGKEKFKANIKWRNGVIVADEPLVVGGKDWGPDPYTLLLSSLVACTLSTLRMYIDRKGWTINSINVTANMYQANSDVYTTTIERDISFDDTIDDEQREKLLLIASKCPVSKILENKIIIQTKL